MAFEPYDQSGGLGSHGSKPDDTLHDGKDGTMIEQNPEQHEYRDSTHLNYPAADKSAEDHVGSQREPNRWRIGWYPRPKHSRGRTSEQRRWPPGACLAADDQEAKRLKQWLERYELSAKEFRFDDIDDFIRLIEDQLVAWVVVATAGALLPHPQFNRLFRALIESETDLWDADNDSCLSDDLFCAAVENWDFVTPFACADSAGPSLTSQADMLRRIESRVREMATLMLTARTSTQHPMEMRLSPKEEELLAAAGAAPLRGEALANRAGHQYDGHTKAALSTLVKFGCLAKTKGGYIRIKESHDESGLTFPKRP